MPKHSGFKYLYKLSPSIEILGQKVIYMDYQNKLDS